MVLGVILTLVVLVFAAWFFFGSSRGPTVEPARPSGGDTNIQVNPPSVPKVDVQVNPPAQQAPAAPVAPAAPAGQNEPATKAP
jgi:hypothetical protein